jgi:hypothetical protein
MGLQLRRDGPQLFFFLCERILNDWLEYKISNILFELTAEIIIKYNGDGNIDERNKFHAA